MASLGHIAVGLVVGRLYADRCSVAMLSPALVFSALAIAPDVDIVAFALRIPYEAEWGHRGASHALLLSGVAGASIAGLWAGLRAWCGHPARPAVSSLLGAVAMASHGLLDTLTDGGRGVALLWPFSLERFFAPWRPIPAAPLGHHFFSAAGLHCAVVEAIWFAPLWVYALRPGRAERMRGASSR